MQRKHLIAFTLATIVMLLGFNIINSNQHEKNRAERVESETTLIAETDETDNNDSVDIAAQPLGAQPKAMLDKATTQIEAAQQADADRLAQMDGSQE